MKNLLHLYNYYPNYTFKKCVLVDDSLYNFTPEYSYIIVPLRKSKGLYIESYIENNKT